MTKITLNRNNNVFKFPSYSIGKTINLKISINEDTFKFGYSLQGISQESFANYSNRKVWKAGQDWKTRIRTFADTKYKVLSSSEVEQFKQDLLRYNAGLEELITGEYLDPLIRMLR